MVMASKGVFNGCRRFSKDLIVLAVFASPPIEFRLLLLGYTLFMPVVADEFPLLLFRTLSNAFSRDEKMDERCSLVGELEILVEGSPLAELTENIVELIKLVARLLMIAFALFKGLLDAGDKGVMLPALKLLSRF